MSMLQYPRKRLYQIRKFLLHIGFQWGSELNPPAQPEYPIKRVSRENIQKTIEVVGNNRCGIRYVALTLLGATSGMRAEEMYQLHPDELHPDDVDLDERMVRINHNPSNGQTTKTKKSRIAFFNEETREALKEYLPIYENDSRIKHLFSKRQCERAFQDAPIQVKDLRKFFSQEWDRQGGATTIKKMLMGHSLRGDVDLMHYNFQSEDDLKGIYDKVGIKVERES